MNRREFGLSLLGLTAAAALDPVRGSAALRALAPPRVNGERLMGQLLALAEFGKNPEGGVSRVAYSEADRQGREYALGLMRAAGLQTHIDAAGNLIGRRAGSDPSLKPLSLGSHIDSVPKGGNYDGPVGSLAAIEVARTLGENGTVTRHPLEVIIFSNEEGGKTGSRVLDGEFEPRELELKTASGKTIREGIRFIGGDPERLDEARRPAGSVAAFLELHIEQGGILEAQNTDIGVVEGIVGIKRWNVAVEGFANHAGTTPMDQRKDALLAAARFVDLVNRVARETPGQHVATVGKLQVEPGAPNVIAGRAIASLEIRDLDLARIDALFTAMAERTERIGAETGTRFGFEEIYLSRPAIANPGIQRAIDASAKQLGLTTRPMPSGAGHDAQSMARLGPMGMIFVPSVGGISHSPEEFTHPKDVVHGANVLLLSLLALDREGAGGTRD
jgi:N-carbamoyl-L-amino-acid hydrolase